MAEAISGEVRQLFERLLVQHYTDVGRDAFMVKPVVDRFLADAGGRASKTSCYRWASALIASGALHQSAASNGGRGDPSVTADGTIAADIQPAPEGGALSVVADLQNAIAMTREVMVSARSLRHKPEQARLLIAAADVLRRCLDSAVRWREAIYTVERLDRFHQEIIATIREECPAAADRLLLCLEGLAQGWATGARR